MIKDEHVCRLNLCPASFSRTQQAHPPHQPATPTEPKTVQFHCTLVEVVWWVNKSDWSRKGVLQWMVLPAKLPVALDAVAACLCYPMFLKLLAAPQTSHSARSCGVPTDRGTIWEHRKNIPLQPAQFFMGFWCLSRITWIISTIPLFLTY